MRYNITRLTLHRKETYYAYYSVDIATPYSPSGLFRIDGGEMDAASDVAASSAIPRLLT